MMLTLTLAQHQSRMGSSKILEADGLGPKVLLLSNGTMAKLFRRRIGLSSDKLRPYSLRFVRNAIKLKKNSIQTLTPLERYRVIDSNLDVVIYQPLAGDSLKDLSKHHPHLIDENLSIELGRYIGELHNRGIFFRSLHLGNILRLQNSEFGLIDIADLSVHRFRLSQPQKLRNFKHLVRMTEFKDPLKTHKDALMQGYFSIQKTSSDSFRQQLDQLLSNW